MESLKGQGLDCKEARIEHTQVPERRSVLTVVMSSPSLVPLCAVAHQRCQT